MCHRVGAELFSLVGQLEMVGGEGVVSHLGDMDNWEAAPQTGQGGQRTLLECLWVEILFGSPFFSVMWGDGW